MSCPAPTISAICLSSFVLAGCAAYDSNPPLVFGKVDRLGISASATTADQGGDLNVGFKSAKIAVVPVTVTHADGSVEKLIVNRGGGNSGAFSTFAHFEATASATGPGACLGDTFATGLAAQAIAQNLSRVCGPAR